MPEEMEKNLIAEAHKKGLGKERMGKYVYGTMAKMKKKKKSKFSNETIMKARMMS